MLGLVVLAATSFAASPKQADSASAPVVTASGAGDISETRATIGVGLAPRDLHTRVYGEYGTSTGYGERTAEFLVPPGDDVIAVYRPLAHLEPGTQYHFHWVVSNPAGQLVTPDQTFTTAGADATAAAGTAVQGLFVSIAEASGQVRVRRAGRHRFTELSKAAGVPVGSVLDARHGKVRLTSALPGGGTQTATFHGGRFEVGQSASSGRVDIHLRGGSLRGCRSARASAAAPAATTSRKRRRRHRIRSLWGEDSSGLYSTYGLNSVATVRGTRWLTVDRCDGTLTKVTEGAVDVVNRRTGRTTVVTAGHSHLARRVG